MALGAVDRARRSRCRDDSTSKRRYSRRKHGRRRHWLSLLLILFSSSSIVVEDLVNFNVDVVIYVDSFTFQIPTMKSIGIDASISTRIRRSNHRKLLPQQQMKSKIFCFSDEIHLCRPHYNRQQSALFSNHPSSKNQQQYEEQPIWDEQRDLEENSVALNVVQSTNGEEERRNDSEFDSRLAPPPPLPPSPTTTTTPDQAIAIVSELKSNAALFAAFAYGGLSLPSILTVTESKVTSVTTSLSVTRPIPSSDLIQSFVVLDVITLCLIVTCVASSQLLIYKLTDGSWSSDLPSQSLSLLSSSSSSSDKDTYKKVTTQYSPLGRLVTSSKYKIEFLIARTSFDLGLTSLLLEVAVRSIAMYDETISIPASVVILGTTVLLVVAFLQSYWSVFRPLEVEENDSLLKSKQTSIRVPSSNDKETSTDTETGKIRKLNSSRQQPTSSSPSDMDTKTDNHTITSKNPKSSQFAALSVMMTLFLTLVIVSISNNGTGGQDFAGDTSVAIGLGTSLVRFQTRNREVKIQLEEHSKEASDRKLKTVLDKVSTEKEEGRASASASTRRTKKPSSPSPYTRGSSEIIDGKNNKSSSLPSLSSSPSTTTSSGSTTTKKDATYRTSQAPSATTTEAPPSSSSSSSTTAARAGGSNSASKEEISPSDIIVAMPSSSRKSHSSSPHIDVPVN